MFAKLMVAVDFDEGRGEFLKCLGGLRSLGAKEAVVAFCVDMPDIAGVRASLKAILGGELDALQARRSDRACRALCRRLPQVFRQARSSPAQRIREGASDGLESRGNAGC